MYEKGYIEIQVTRNDYCTLNLVDGISIKLNIGDKIVLENENLKENSESFLWKEEALRTIRQQPNRWLQNSNRCFIQINEKLFHGNYIELHGVVVQPDSDFYSKPIEK